MTHTSIFNEKGLKGLEKLIQSHQLGISQHEAYSHGYQALSYYKSTSKDREELRPLLELEQYWYESLRNGNPAYDVYGQDVMIPDVYACWDVYSRNYLLKLASPKSLVTLSIIDFIGEVKIAVDLGCGIGYTTCGLKELFPDATVYGTQLPNTTQYKIASAMTSMYKNVHIIPDTSAIKSDVDVVFASEYFEHFYTPIEHLQEVILNVRPRFFILANSFNTTSVGHFIQYKDGDTIIPQEQISKAFRQSLRDSGYQEIKTKLWNGRPSIWMRK